MKRLKVQPNVWLLAGYTAETRLPGKYWPTSSVLCEWEEELRLCKDMRWPCLVWKFSETGLAGLPAPVDTKVFFSICLACIGGVTDKMRAKSHEVCFSLRKFNERGCLDCQAHVLLSQRVMSQIAKSLSGATRTRAAENWIFVLVTF